VTWEVSAPRASAFWAFSPPAFACSTDRARRTQARKAAHLVAPATTIASYLLSPVKCATKYYVCGCGVLYGTPASGSSARV
jgi:hypothetical protein